METSTKDQITNHNSKVFVVVLSCPIFWGGKIKCVRVCVCVSVCLCVRVHVHVWIVQEEVNSKKAYVKL